MVRKSKNNKITDMEDKITHLASTHPHEFKQYKNMMDDRKMKIDSMKKQTNISDAHLMQNNELEKEEKDH